MRFSIGDVVIDSRSNVLMTVEGTDSDGRVLCVWFDKENALHRAAFQPSILVKESL